MMTMIVLDLSIAMQSLHESTLKAFIMRRGCARPLKLVVDLMG